MSARHRFAGPIDVVEERDGGLHLLDLKTRNHQQSEMVIQLAAYKRLYEEIYKVPILSQNIIKLSKDSPEYEFYPVDIQEDQAGWEVFLSLIEVEKRKKLLSKFGK